MHLSNFIILQAKNKPHHELQIAMIVCLFLELGVENTSINFNTSLNLKPYLKNVGYSSEARMRLIYEAWCQNSQATLPL